MRQNTLEPDFQEIQAPKKYCAKKEYSNFEKDLENIRRAVLKPVESHAAQPESK
jgi:hypothetical protein